MRVKDDECNLRYLSDNVVSKIITSQLPVMKWYEIIGENTIADAILNQIVHHESIRKRNNKSNSSIEETD